MPAAADGADSCGRQSNRTDGPGRRLGEIHEELPMVHSDGIEDEADIASHEYAQTCDELVVVEVEHSLPDG